MIACLSAPMRRPGRTVSRRCRGSHNSRAAHRGRRSCRAEARARDDRRRYRLQLRGGLSERHLVLVDADKQAAGAQLLGRLEGVPREAERGVHEHRMIRKVEGVDAFGEKNGYVPVFAWSRFARFPLAVEQPRSSSSLMALKRSASQISKRPVLPTTTTSLSMPTAARTSGDSMMRPEASTSTSRARLFSTRRS